MVQDENKATVSVKEQVYEDPKLLDYIKNKAGLSKPDQMLMGVRAMNGFYIACHVFAYLSGKEGKHSSTWEKEHKRCANMLSRALVGMNIYDDAIDELMPEDFTRRSAVKGRPILTKNIICEAARRFPLDGLLVDGLFAEDDEKPNEYIRDKDVLAEFLYRLNVENQFLLKAPLWSSPQAGFLYDGSFPRDFSVDFISGLSEKKVVPVSEDIIGVLADWNTGSVEGLFFTDKALYVNSPKNKADKKFKVRFDKIRELEYCTNADVDIYTEDHSWHYTIDTRLWSGRSIYNFLVFASGKYGFEEKLREKIMQLRLNTADGHDVAEIVSGASRYNKDEMVSCKEELYIPEEIIEANRQMMDKEERKMLRNRARSGFYVACHAFAYLSGKENLYDSSWDADSKLCANMIARTIGFQSIYKQIDNDDLKPSDFTIEASDDRPIVLKTTIREAWKRFPVKGVVLDLNKFEGDN